MQLQCKELAIGYEGKVILGGLNFTIDTGDYVCIVGENGVGKSTLLKTLLELKKKMGGELLLGENLKRSEIGYLPQQTAIQKDFPAAVREIVRTGFLAQMGLRFFYTKEEKAKADRIMDKLGIIDLKDQSYQNLSGGQQQRVLLARALCATEKVLFLDEPVAGLDVQTTKELYQIIEKLNKEDKITIIMVTHDLHGVLPYANKVLHLEADSYFWGTKEAYRQYSKKLLSDEVESN